MHTRLESGQLDSAVDQFEANWCEDASVYQAACVHSLVAREHSLNEQKAESIDNALVYLSRAVQQGYGADLLATDPDLDPLRGDERFRTIVSAVALGQVKKR